MSTALLADMFYAAPELWYGIGAVLLFLLGAWFFTLLKLLKLRQKNYFLNRDRERYAETLYASKDGYFAFVYPDEKVNDPHKTIKERCSRRLAVIMNLPGGTQSSFEDILKSFYRDDAKKILKYLDLLFDDGVSFEDTFTVKSNNKRLRLSGSRINGIDGNVYCDMIWFRDVSFEDTMINNLEAEKAEAYYKISLYEDLINNIPYPIWLRDENLKLDIVNRRYNELLENKTGSERELLSAAGEPVSKNLAFLAHATNKIKRQQMVLIHNGERRSMEVVETPFHFDQSLDKICTAGAMFDITELDELKRNLKLNQNAHLEILGTLAGTAFAVFNSAYKLSFYNKSLADMWNLEESWLDEQPLYSTFLDMLREKRLLPEVPDFILFKNEEQKDFSNLIEAKEDMLYRPDGRTIRRIRAPYPAGGVVFAYEDVSDNLATRRAYQALLDVQKETIDNLFDAVLIFADSGRLKFYNQAYVELWQSDETFLRSEPNISEVIDSQKRFFSQVDDWESLKKYILNHIVNFTTKIFELKRDDIEKLEVLSGKLSDGSIMITYKTGR